MIEDKIKEIYERRQKAHEELLKCDLEIDELLRDTINSQKE